MADADRPFEGLSQVHARWWCWFLPSSLWLVVLLSVRQKGSQGPTSFRKPVSFSPTYVLREVNVLLAQKSYPECRLGAHPEVLPRCGRVVSELAMWLLQEVLQASFAWFLVPGGRVDLP